MKRSTLIPPLPLPASYVVRYQLRPGQQIALAITAESRQEAAMAAFIELMEHHYELDAPVPVFLSCEPTFRRAPIRADDPLAFLCLAMAAMLALGWLFATMAAPDRQLPQGGSPATAELFPTNTETKGVES